MSSPARSTGRLKPEPRLAPRQTLPADRGAAESATQAGANTKRSRAASIVAEKLKCCTAEQFLVWVDAVSPRVTTPEALVHSFCRDCVPAFRRQMELEERCIQRLTKPGEPAAAD